jgi:tRNA modification GTPase
VSLEGVPIHLVDTAGLRVPGDEIERIGIERTWRAVESAGAALYVTEVGLERGSEETEILERLPAGLPIAHVVNKIDLSGKRAPAMTLHGETVLYVSAKTGEGLELLRKWLLETAGWKPHGEGLFMARARHLFALEVGRKCLLSAGNPDQAFELKAEDLRVAQQYLSSITGEFGADDLLGEIFSRFCIGK